MADTMTAACVPKPGPSQSIEIASLPIPTPQANDLLIRVQASAVNHVDTFIRSGTFPTPMPSPFVIGRDLVGTVVDSGQRVTDFAAGEPVWCNSLGYGGRQGAFAEYALADADRVYRLPAGVRPEDAVATLHPAATAYLGVFRHAQLRLGETIVVFGAAGGVGSAVVQLASAAGIRVVALAREEDADWCRSCGAGEVLDYRDPDVFARIADVVPDGAEAVWDTSGRNELAQLASLVTGRGRILLTAGMGRTMSVPVGTLYTQDVSLHGFVLSNATLTELANAAQVINHQLASGRLGSRIATRLPLTEAGEAHRRQEVGVRGRIVVQM